MQHSWTYLYEYYFAGGLLCFILDSLASIIIAAVISFMPILLFGCLQYAPIKSVTQINELIVPVSEGFLRANIFIKTCSIIFSVYTLFLVFQFLSNLPKFIRIHFYYKKKLGIPDRELTAIIWNEVVESVLIHEPSESRTMLSVAQEILRNENYLIALISDPSILTWKVPFLKKRTRIPMSRFFFYTFHLALSGIVLDSHGGSIVNGVNTIHNRKTAQRLKTRFRLFGLFMFILTPFIFAFQLLYLIFHYAQAIKNSPGTLSMRRWTPLSKWLIREYNELPHLLAERIRKSYLFANFYMDLFPSPLVQPLVRVGSFLSGALLAIFFIFGLLTDSGFLLTIPILGNKSLAWLMSIIATIYGVCRMMIPNEERPFDPDESLEQVEKNIHYDFRDENNSARSWATYDKLSEFFQPLFLHLLFEILSVAFNPFLFGVILPEKAQSIVDFIERNSINVPEIGWICAFSGFDGNEKIQGQNPEQNMKLKRSMAFFNSTIGRQASLIDFNSSLIVADESLPMLTRSSFSNSNELLNELNASIDSSPPCNPNCENDSFIV
ncbi:autophagy protein [Tritrichomonas foetus]|uniref:Autophagy-related protein 9 n=1 Tax=Tritrichomonas foetus TaxID=1144522 RepID=A0A1J4KGE6_9EUKA|nr:autophagy protein [Tritrichomonas foetus]|eukprot:OHT08726.1 autophagy protein [Tritrichomonas foetus]